MHLQRKPASSALWSLVHGAANGRREPILGIRLAPVLLISGDPSIVEQNAEIIRRVRAFFERRTQDVYGYMSALSIAGVNS
ncbi:hypothetical protein BOA8489_03691 [Boseongicola aestuarii]|uniref:Uncharacterized protein n=1 Tax=Boseongicola aestuarii TaxID=1470561 RepID=A0A238J4K7_9RHOB|nr:hypothetical protein BOA8489_03691 [Boseongicola aestuarii]